jgi:aldehyde dehydrogenase (NAD+)
MLDRTVLSPAEEARSILADLGVSADALSGKALAARSPIDGALIGHLAVASPADAAAAIGRAQSAFQAWRKVPAPRRGELVRLLGEELRTSKQLLGRLVSLEAGKIVSEGLGEVQEMIDICDFAVGLSRQLYGLTIATERPGHRMMETWHPLGVVGIISAFNFPVAVWSWNAALALVCGNACIWKPSEKTPLTALAVQAIFERAAARFGDAPDHLSSLLIGAADVGEVLVDDHRVALISATGSTRMGRAVGQKLAARFARSLLELGGNNAMIVSASADQQLAVRGIAFAAMGTAGQRCTTLRRLFVHRSIYQPMLDALKRIYGSVTIGDPRRPDVLVGPLIDQDSFQAMQAALESAKAQGGRVHGGERISTEETGEGYYVRPALVELDQQTDIVKSETFAPILYVMPYDNWDQVMQAHNAVAHGLSSSIFTTDLREAEAFIAAEGSDCGIANVNIGPSGAEIGGAFGGEKETGGGRESGSDAWRAYMRRATNTVNYSSALPLAQGVSFDI